MRPLSDSQREALEEATSTYQAAVTPAVAAYLRGRGFSRELAATFRVGVVADPLPGHGPFRGFLAIPYLDQHGKPLTIRFRCIAEHNHRDHGHGKYMTMADDPPRMFNVGAIHRASDTIHVTEGELDAMTLESVGLPAVAIPGANLWKPHHRRMLAGFSRVWVWGDPDDAGAELVAKIGRSLRQSRGVKLRGGDVNETYLAGGPEALLELVE